MHTHSKHISWINAHMTHYDLVRNVHWQIFINGEGQGVMIDGLPKTLYYVVDGGDQGQCIRITGATRPPSQASRPGRS